MHQVDRHSQILNEMDIEQNLTKSHVDYRYYQI